MENRAFLIAGPVLVAAVFVAGVLSFSALSGQDLPAEQDYAPAVYTRTLSASSLNWMWEGVLEMACVTTTGTAIFLDVEARYEDGEIWGSQVIPLGPFPIITGTGVFTTLTWTWEDLPERAVEEFIRMRAEVAEEATLIFLPDKTALLESGYKWEGRFDRGNVFVGAIYGQYQAIDTWQDEDGFWFYGALQGDGTPTPAPTDTPWYDDCPPAPECSPTPSMPQPTYTPRPTLVPTPMPTCRKVEICPPWPTPLPTATYYPTLTPWPTQPSAAASSFSYGMAMAVPMDEAAAGYEEIIRLELGRLRALGIDTIWQSFAIQSTEIDWMAFLDVAQREGMRVVAWFRDLYAREIAPEWDGEHFVLGKQVETFLEATKSHLALAGFMIVVEPFHERYGGDLTAEELRSLYAQAKAIAPGLDIAVAFTYDISVAEEYGFTDYAFSDGMCDICIIGALPFRDGTWHKEGMIFHRRLSRRVITREAPDAKIYSVVQTFGGADSELGWLDMPAPSQIRDFLGILSTLEYAGQTSGFVFLLWKPYYSHYHDADVLSEPEFEAQREVIRTWISQRF